MLRYIFILVFAMGIMFVLDSTTAQNANACPTCELENCELFCQIEPTCLCAYGGNAYNHLRLSYCVEDNPDGTDGCSGLQPPFAPEAACEDREMGLVIPLSIGANPANETYCRWRCECV